MRDWIVIQGEAARLVNTLDGRGGFEFFGPFTHEEATFVRLNMEHACAVQLVKLPNMIRAHKEENDG
jgi:hypothetical protein